jgi:hypothetical protein
MWCYLRSLDSDPNIKKGYWDDLCYEDYLCVRKYVCSEDLYFWDGDFEKNI